MGVLEDILARAQFVPAEDTWLPQTMLPPHKRNHIAAVDASMPAIQSALGNAPSGPAIPPSLMMHEAGMIPLDQAASPYTTPEGRQMMAGVGVDAPVEATPMPRARPADAPGPVYPDDGASPAPAAMAAPPATDLSSRAKGGAPLQIAPQMPATAAPPLQAGMMSEGPSILDRIRTGLSDNSNTLLAIGAGFAGAPNIGQGISRAAAAAIPASQADIRNRLTRQTQGTGLQALIDAGVPRSLAVAALGNPAIMKSVTENYLGDRKGQIIDIGFDRYGQPIKGIFDPFSKKITPISEAAASEKTASTIGAGGGAMGTSTSTDISSAKAGAPNPSVGSGMAVTAENDITGPDFLQRLKETDPPYARQVEQVLNGDAAMPTGRQAQTPMGKKLRQDVLTVEPGASDADFATRTMVRKSYAGGNDAKITKSINTTLKHAQTLEKAINDLDNFSTLPILNYPRAAVEGQTSEKYRKARAAYDTAVANFGKELDFTVSGGRPTVSGTKHQMEGFDATAAKDAQLEKLRTGVELLKGRLDSHATGYAKGMRKGVEPVDFINQENRGFYKRLLADETAPTGIDVPGVNGGPAPAAVPAAPVAKGTVKIGDQVIPWSVN